MLGVTFFGTVIDLEKGIFFGIVASLIFYLQGTSRPAIRSLLPDAKDRGNLRRKFVVETGTEPDCPQLKLLRVEGSIFFGAVDHIQQAFAAVDEHVPSQRHLLLFARGINTIDLAGAELLSHEARRRRRMGGGLYLCGLRDAACDMLKRGGYQSDIGEDRIFAHKPEAIAAIYARLDPERCRTCTARIFRECREHLPNGEMRPAADIERFIEKTEDVSPASAGFKRLTEIVTRTGDDGSTGLADGTRLAKHAPRIEAIGAVDELNSQIGVLLDALAGSQPGARGRRAAPGPGHRHLQRRPAAAHRIRAARRQSGCGAGACLPHGLPARGAPPDRAGGKRTAVNQAGPVPEPPVRPAVRALAPHQPRARPGRADLARMRAIAAEPICRR